jgi:hypothetical protein
LPAYGEKVLAYKAEQRLGTGETMRRREFIALMGASVAWPFAALAQEPGRTYRLGCLFGSPRGSAAEDAWFDKLRRRGFTEGQNLTVEYRAFGQHVDLIPQYAAELVRHGSISSQLSGMKQFASSSRRQRRYRSLRSEAICSGLDW